MNKHFMVFILFFFFFSFRHEIESLEHLISTCTLLPYKPHKIMEWKSFFKLVNELLFMNCTYCTSQRCVGTHTKTDIHLCVLTGGWPLLKSNRYLVFDQTKYICAPVLLFCLLPQKKNCMHIYSLDYVG